MDTYILSYLLRWYVTNNSRTVFTELELWDYLNQVAPSSKKQELMSALTELKNEGYITQFIQDINSSSLVIYFNKDRLGRAA